MIISQIQTDNRYNEYHPLFKKAFEFLKTENLNLLPVGKTEINEDNLFAIISKPGNSIEENPKLEAHKKYLDIHFILEGTELFGWKNLDNCKNKIGDFDVEKDYILFDDQEFSSILLIKNNIAIVYPEDAHAPCIQTINLHKIVLKVKI